MLKISNFSLANVDEVEPNPNEKEIMLAYRSGAPDYQAAISQEDLIKELGLQACLCPLEAIICPPNKERTVLHAITQRTVHLKRLLGSAGRFTG